MFLATAAPWGFLLVRISFPGENRLKQGDCDPSCGPHPWPCIRITCGGGVVVRGGRFSDSGYIRVWGVAGPQYFLSSQVLLYVARSENRWLSSLFSLPCGLSYAPRKKKGRDFF